MMAWSSSDDAVPSTDVHIYPGTTFRWVWTLIGTACYLSNLNINAFGDFILFASGTRYNSERLTLAIFEGTDNNFHVCGYHLFWHRKVLYLLGLYHKPFQLLHHWGYCFNYHISHNSVQISSRPCMPISDQTLKWLQLSWLHASLTAPIYYFLLVLK